MHEEGNILRGLDARIRRPHRALSRSRRETSPYSANWWLWLGRWECGGWDSRGWWILWDKLSINSCPGSYLRSLQIAWFTADWSSFTCLNWSINFNLVGAIHNITSRLVHFWCRWDRDRQGKIFNELNGNGSAWKHFLWKSLDWFKRRSIRIRCWVNWYYDHRGYSFVRWNLCRP